MAVSQEFELSPLELAAWRGFLRVHSSLFKELDQQLDSRFKLPLTHYEVLISLLHAPDRRLRMAELADRVLLSRSGMTRLVDRLERDGYVRRDNCTTDARGSFAVLTDAGMELLEKARPAHLIDVRERFLRHLDEDDLAALARIWERLLPGVTS